MWVVSALAVKNILKGLIKEHCTVSSGNGMVFKILTSRVLAFFDNLQIFQNFWSIVFIHVFPAPGG